MKTNIYYKALIPSTQSVLEVVKFTVSAGCAKEYTHEDSDGNEIVKMEIAGSFRNAANLSWEQYHNGDVCVSTRQAHLATGRCPNWDDETNLFRLLINPTKTELVTIKSAFESGIPLDQFYVSDYVYGVTGKLVHFTDATNDFKKWRKITTNYSKLETLAREIHDTGLGLSRQLRAVEDAIKIFDTDAIPLSLSTNRIATDNVLKRHTAAATPVMNTIAQNATMQLSNLVAYRNTDTGDLISVSEASEHDIDLASFMMSDMFFDHKTNGFVSLVQYTQAIIQYTKNKL